MFDLRPSALGLCITPLWSDPVSLILTLGNSLNVRCSFMLRKLLLLFHTSTRYNFSTFSLGAGMFFDVVFCSTFWISLHRKSVGFKCHSALDSWTKVETENLIPHAHTHTHFLSSNNQRKKERFNCVLTSVV